VEITFPTKSKSFVEVHCSKITSKDFQSCFVTLDTVEIFQCFLYESFSNAPSSTASFHIVSKNMLHASFHLIVNVILSTILGLPDQDFIAPRPVLKCIPSESFYLLIQWIRARIKYTLIRTSSNHANNRISIFNSSLPNQGVAHPPRVFAPSEIRFGYDFSSK
jgi:hypothetical protein